MEINNTLCIKALMFYGNQKYTGKESISQTLSKEGFVITTINHTEIWLGGVGNFMKSKSIEGGLVEITLDLVSLMKSELLKGFRVHIIEEVEKEISALKLELSDKEIYVQELVK